MANRALKKTAKVLGGLGAAYVLSDMLGPKVTGVTPEAEAADRAKRLEDQKKYLVNKPPESVESSTARPPEAPITSQVVLPELNDSQKRRAESSKRLAEVTDRLNREFPMNRVPGSFFKKGGVVKASRRADGIAQRGKTRGKMV